MRHLLYISSFPTRRSSDLQHIEAFFAEQHNRQVIQKLLQSGIYFEKIPEKTNFPLAGKVYVLTGTLTKYSREEAKEKLERDRKSTRLNSSHIGISYAVLCL